jgi:hypothetical protein
MAEHEEYLHRVCANATEDMQAVADRCAQLDIKFAKSEKLAQEWPEGRQRLGSHGVSKADRSATPVAAVQPQVSARTKEHARAQQASPLRLNSSEPLFLSSTPGSGTQSRPSVRVASSGTPHEEVCHDTRSSSKDAPRDGSSSCSHRQKFMAWSGSTSPSGPGHNATARISLRSRDSRDSGEPTAEGTLGVSRHRDGKDPAVDGVSSVSSTVSTRSTSAHANLGNAQAQVSQASAQVSVFQSKPVVVADRRSPLRRNTEPL